MDFWSIVGPVTTGATTLGFAASIFFAYRNKTDQDVLRNTNGDLRNLNLDYKETINTLKADVLVLSQKVKSLENEKKLPLEELTKLVVSQHTQQLKVLRDIAKALNAKPKEVK